MWVLIFKTDSKILLLDLDLAVRAALSEILVLLATLKENGYWSMEHSELDFEINICLALTLRLVLKSLVTLYRFFDSFI